MAFDMNFVFREVLEDATDLFERIGSGRLELVFTGSEQVAGGQVDEQPLVVEIDGNIFFVDLWFEGSNQPALRFLELGHFCGKVAAEAGQFLIAVGQLSVEIRVAFPGRFEICC